MVIWQRIVLLYMKQPYNMKKILFIGFLFFAAFSCKKDDKSSGATDVYVAGSEYNGAKDTAKVWKNGVATSLTNGVNNAEGYSVYVSGTDVYVSGYEDNGTS